MTQSAESRRRALCCLRLALDASSALTFAEFTGQDDKVAELRKQRDEAAEEFVDEMLLAVEGA